MWKITISLAVVALLCFNKANPLPLFDSDENFPFGDFEPVKFEPRKFEPMKFEPMKFEPMKFDPMRFEPIKFEPMSMPTFEKMKFPDFPTLKPLTENDIMNIKPSGPGSHVHAVSMHSSSSRKVVNGRVVEDRSESGGIINEDGKITEIKNK